MQYTFSKNRNPKIDGKPKSRGNSKKNQINLIFGVTQAAITPTDTAQ